MATIIDTLVVAFGLDAKGVEKGSGEVRKETKKTKEEIVKAGKDIERAGGDAAEFFNKLKNEAMALIAVFTGGYALKQFSQNTISTAANVGLLSENLNVSTKDLLAWQMANEKAGGTQSGMLAQLKESADQVALIKSGFKAESTDMFFASGGSLQNVKTGNDYLLERSRIISKIYQTDPTKAQMLSRQMGISEDTFNLIKQGPAAVEALVKAQEHNAAISEKNAKGALELRERWLELKNTLTATGERIILDFMPAMEKWLASLQKQADWIELHKKDIEDWIESAVKNIREFITWSDKAADSVGGWHVVLAALVAIKVGSGLLSIAATLSGIAASLTTIAAVGGGKLLGLLGPAGAAAYILKQTDLDNNDAMMKKMNEDARKKDEMMPSHVPFGKDPQSLFNRLEKQYGLPSGVLDSMWAQESGRGKNMLSPKGAQGHFQFMPETAKAYGLKDPNDLNESAEAAARMMADLLKANNGNLEKALGAYNGGGRGSGPNPLPETRNYIREVEGRMGGQTQNNEVNINGPITITTQAKDGESVARGFQEYMKDSGWLSAQANSAIG